MVNKCILIKSNSIWNSPVGNKGKRDKNKTEANISLSTVSFGYINN